VTTLIARDRRHRHAIRATRAIHDASSRVIGTTTHDSTAPAAVAANHTMSCIAIFIAKFDWGGWYTGMAEKQYVEVVPRAMRVSSDVITTAEYYEVTGARGAAIERGAQPFITIEHPGGWSPCDIAAREIREKKCPMRVIRQFPRGDGVVLEEHWDVNEMVVNVR
jgi:DNA-directed RNA polymerase subunit K/omega